MKQSFLILLIGCLILNNSCQKDFLETSPSAAKSIDQSFETAKDFEVALNGCYSGLQSKMLYGRNLPVIGEVLADNVKPSPNNLSRFINLYNYTHTSSNQYIKEIWSQSYSVINACNVILYNITTNNSLTVTESNSIKSQTLAIRSLCFLNLFQLFSPSYDKEKKEQLSIPLPLEPVNFSENEGLAQSKSTEVVDIILSDLKVASVIATEESTSPFYFNRLSIQALLSRASLVAKDYVHAALYADSVLKSGVFHLVENETYVESWQNEYTSESIFSIKFDKNDFAGTESFSYLFNKEGYGDFIATEDLLSKIGPRDARSQLYAGNYCEKYPKSGNTVGLNSFPVIRLSEMYLNFAEALINLIEEGRNLDEKEVITYYLDPIKKRANPSISQTEKSGSYLLDEIYNEFQREFAFEGHRFFNLKRRKEVMSRIDCASNNCTIQIWKGEKYLATLPFPQSEINANPKIKQNDNF